MRQLGGGARISWEFQYIDPKPLASASVAQVHRAKLRTGEEVVLKVRHVAVLCRDVQCRGLVGAIYMYEHRRTCACGLSLSSRVL